ncbi:MAG: hypothetical protein BA863_07840 [Desulfovibrio sp. S3730MH75]|nr:MAG: hypothetical protein BA863_07840 [Desulfovibrio sp. S3730MH75]
MWYINSETIHEVLTSVYIRQAFVMSLVTSIASTVICILVAIPTAYALSRFPFKGIIIFDILVDSLIVIPVLVVGISLLVFFRMGSDLGESNIWLVRMLSSGITRSGEFFIYKQPGIVLAQFFCSVSFAIRAIKAAFDGVNPRTEHVALTLGCTRADAFRRITLPMAKHGIVAGAVLSWARAYGVFGAVSFVAGSVRARTEVLPTSIFLELSIGRLDVSLGVSLLMIAVAFLMLLLLRIVFGANIFGYESKS